MDEIEKGLHKIHAKARTKKEQPDHLTEKHTEVLLGWLVHLLNHYQRDDF